MKDLLIKEHYCYKIHTLLMKSKAYPSFYRQLPPPSPLYGLQLSHFYKKNLNTPSMIFQKSPETVLKVR